MVFIEVRVVSKIAQQVGERIRKLRHERGVSQEQLALKAGITPSYLGQVERGEKSPTIDSVDKVARALQVSLEELFSFEHAQLAHVDRQVIDKIAFELSGRTKIEQQMVYQFIKQILLFRDQK
jgi:transcriptional regulator with XRE-family HTH domain